MADLKISALTASTTPLAGTEVLPIVQSSTTKKVSVANLTAGRSVGMQQANISAAAGGGFGNPAFIADDGTGSARIVFLGSSYAGVPANKPWLHSYQDIYIGSDASTSVNFVSGGSVLSTSNGNLVPASGKGIDFSATPGTGTSELFADYEEGTWTPVDSSGAGLGLTITGTSTYTKIGRQVIATADITYPVTVNASLTLVGGLPFTSGAAPSGSGSIGYTDYGTWITVSPGAAATSFRFIGAAGFLTNVNLSGKRVVVTVIYIV